MLLTRLSPGADRSLDFSWLTRAIVLCLYFWLLIENLGLRHGLRFASGQLIILAFHELSQTESVLLDLQVIKLVLDVDDSASDMRIDHRMLVDKGLVQLVDLTHVMHVW